MMTELIGKRVQGASGMGTAPGGHVRRNRIFIRVCERWSVVFEDTSISHDCHASRTVLLLHSGKAREHGS